MASVHGPLPPAAAGAGAAYACGGSGSGGAALDEGGRDESAPSQGGHAPSEDAGSGGSHAGDAARDAEISPSRGGGARRRAAAPRGVLPGTERGAGTLQLRAHLSTLVRRLPELSRQKSQQGRAWVARRRQRARASWREAEERLRGVRERLRRYEVELTEWSDSLAPFGDTKLRLFLQRALYTGMQIALMGACFALGKDPTNSFAIFYAFLSLGLPVKAYYYFSSDQQYFLGDYCYWVNLLTAWTLAPLMVGGRVCAHSLAVCYVASNGPVAWATLAWQFELVPYHMDKITSMLVHVLPALVTQVARFRVPHVVDGASALSLLPSAAPAARGAAVRWLLLAPLAFYAAWQAFNFVLLQVVCFQHLRSNPHIETSYRTLARRASRGGGNALHRLVVGPPGRAHAHWWRVTAFGLLQLAFTVATGAIGVALWHSEAASTVFLGAVVVTAVYNASRYQFVTVPRRFRRSLHAIWEESAAATAAAATAVAASDEPAEGGGLGEGEDAPVAGSAETAQRDAS